jgi:dipeptidyl-peptidase-4
MTDRRALTFQDIARMPAPGMNVPVAARFSPDGQLVTYLYSSEGTLTRELWAYDLQTQREWRVLEPPSQDTDATVSREEALRRERQRQYGKGVTGYAWSEVGSTLLVQTGGEVLVRTDGTGAFRAVAQGGACIDPRLNRDGTRLAFVRDGELYSLDLTDPAAQPMRLTFDASPADAYGDRPITNGLAEFVAQEEMGRSAGFWWSDDGQWLAFEQVDNSPVPLYFIPHPGTDAVEIEAHRYPFAGKANVRWRLGVVPAQGGAVRWLPVTDGPDSYLARVHWTPDGCVLVQVQSRDQTRLDVRRIDPRTGETVDLWTETVMPWINLTDDLRVVRAEGAPAEDYRILWSSERSGKRELYLFDRDGKQCRQVSHGDILIDQVKGVDADGGWVNVEGWADTPLGRHLFRVPLSGGPSEQITNQPGMSVCTISLDSQQFIVTRSTADSPPVVEVLGIDGSFRATLAETAVRTSRAAALGLGLPPPQLIEVKTRDGESLHAAVYRPPDLRPGQKAPVIVDVYGGPHAQQVTNSWSMTVDLRAQHFAQQGFIVLVLDNRGSARRGLSFEAAIHRNMGDLEVRDQVDGVRALAAFPEADLDRVGVYGWSYGGYMALMCLARAPEVFKAAAVGAPVTHWDGYDTHYTERYMGHPKENAEGYRLSSVMAHVAQIRGALLIVHGMIDENVHFRHTGRLVNALIRAGVPHELLPFPEERHGPRREEDRVFLERRIFEFLKRALTSEGRRMKDEG